MELVVNGELYHHGVTGQKWGIRNGPPYPIEDKTLRKGTRLASVSIEKDSNKYKEIKGLNKSSEEEKRREEYKKNHKDSE